MKIRIVKLNHPSKYLYQVKKVDVDRKYKFFEITIKIYNHHFIQTIPFSECDYIECYNDKLEYGILSKEKVIKVYSANE